MHLHIAIIDDLDTDRDFLCQKLETHFQGCGRCSAEISCFHNAEEFLEQFETGKFDLVFFDICMTGMSGTEAAQHVRKLDKQCLIVFVTSTMEYVFETFAAHPFDYLQKPFSDSQLDALMHEVFLSRSQEDITVSIRVPHGTLDVSVSTIISITADGHVLDFHLSNGESLESSMKFNELEALLANMPQFLTINRGIMINMNYTVSIADGIAHLEDGSFYPVRVREKNKLAAAFSQFMLNKMQEEQI